MIVHVHPNPVTVSQWLCCCWSSRTAAASCSCAQLRLAQLPYSILDTLYPIMIPSSGVLSLPRKLLARTPPRKTTNPEPGGQPFGDLQHRTYGGFHIPSSGVLSLTRKGSPSEISESVAALHMKRQHDLKQRTV